ncbi:trypsin-like peptidase domain-containing protein [Ramlibacter sp. G-1-2-2]|uniref:Trypsin-like peptidase domain-containing protein n=1 Tax=Ramlibacter agri TaxID=2728837 RepID=A0A848H0Y9_9BURK|nr:serine protease [Ramlibacter agri]NML42780.1 trypsin-like peptidase domain-containing protein [Ramlibacter agri]
MAWQTRALSGALAAFILAGPAAAISPEELYERVAPSIWLVENDLGGGKGAIGSAVVVAPGALITNCHVLEKAESLHVVHGPRRFTARLQYKDPARDLCQLQAPSVDAPPVRIAAASQLRVGAKVYALGNPRGLELTLTDGLVSALRHGRAGELEYLQVSVPISPGSSGGGLFDQAGRLVGITTAGMKESQNLNFALPSEWIIELPARAGGRPAVARLETEGPPAPAQVAAAPATATAPERPAPPPAVERDADPNAWLAAGPGRSYEYRLRNRLTGQESSFTLKVDRLEGDRIVFNGGQRIENLRGTLLSPGAALAGEADAAMPPDGWLPGSAIPGSKWRVRRDPQSSPGDIALQLDARAVNEELLQVDGRPIQALRVDYSGYTSRGVTLGRSPTGAYRARAWYARGRLVRFEVRTRGGVGGDTFVVDEVLELVHAR